MGVEVAALVKLLPTRYANPIEFGGLAAPWLVLVIEWCIITISASIHPGLESDIRIFSVIICLVMDVMLSRFLRLPPPFCFVGGGSLGNRPELANK